VAICISNSAFLAWACASAALRCSCAESNPSPAPIKPSKGTVLNLLYRRFRGFFRLRKRPFESRGGIRFLRFLRFANGKTPFLFWRLFHRIPKQEPNASRRKQYKPVG